MSQLGIDHAIVQEMMADGYDPTQQREWAGFRQLTMGDSAMLATKDRVEALMAFREKRKPVFRGE